MNTDSYQGAALAVPQRGHRNLGFSPWGDTFAGAKARDFSTLFGTT